MQRRQELLKQQREKQMQLINYVVGNNNSTNQYLNAERPNEYHPTILNHHGNSRTSKGKNGKNDKSDRICYVVDCGGVGNNSCRSKVCLDLKRTYCDLHYKDGGHKQHVNKQLKEVSI